MTQDLLGVTLAGDADATTELMRGQPDELTWAVAERALDLIAERFSAKQ